MGTGRTAIALQFVLQGDWERRITHCARGMILGNNDADGEIGDDGAEVDIK
jgi:hypothetical protein